MAREPIPFDIALPSVQPRRSVARYDVSPLAQGFSALEKGRERLGQGIETVGKDVAEVETARAKSQTLLAQDNALGEAIQLRQKYKSDTDYATLGERYGQDLDQIAEKHLNTIPDGPLRDHARARLQIPFAHERASVEQQAFTQQRSEIRAGLIDERDELINNTGVDGDPTRTTQFGIKVHRAKEGGFITPVEAESFMRKTASGVKEAEFGARMLVSRKSNADAVRELEMAQMGVGRAASVVSEAETGDRSIGPKALGNISADSKGSKSYGFMGLNSGTGSAAAFAKQYGEQFGLTATPGTPLFDAQWRAAATGQTAAFRNAQLSYFHENHLGSVGADLERRGIPAAIAADPRVQTYFADRAVQMGNVGLDKATQAWNGAGGDPVRFLQNMNAIDGTPQALQSNFKSAIASGVYGPRGHETRLNTRLQGALAAGDETAETGDATYDLLTPAQRNKLINRGHQNERAYQAADRDAEKAQAQAHKDLSDKTEFDIFSALHKDPKNPGFTMQDIIDMGPNGKGILDKAAAERMITLFETRTGLASKEDHDAKTYGTQFHALMERIHPSDGHLLPITDPADIYDAYNRLGPSGELTWAGTEKLIKVINDNRKSIDDHAANTARTGLLNYAKGRLSFEQDTGPIKIRDPKGEAIFNSQFIPKFEAGYDKWVKEGKDPWQYLTRENVDKQLAGMRDPREMAADKISAGYSAQTETEAPNAPLPPVPEGVAETGWKSMMKTTPPLSSGQPMPHKLWGEMLGDLLENPSPPVMANFDRHFGQFGFSVIDALKKLNPAAAAAAEAAAKAGTEPANESGPEAVDVEEAPRAAPAATPAERPGLLERAKSAVGGFIASEREKQRAFNEGRPQGQPAAAAQATPPPEAASAKQQEAERQLADLERQKAEAEALPEGRERTRRLRRIAENIDYYRGFLKK